MKKSRRTNEIPHHSGLSSGRKARESCKVVLRVVVCFGCSKIRTCRERERREALGNSMQLGEKHDSFTFRSCFIIIFRTFLSILCCRKESIIESFSLHLRAVVFGRCSQSDRELNYQINIILGINFLRWQRKVVAVRSLKTDKKFHRLKSGHSPSASADLMKVDKN